MSYYQNKTVYITGSASGIGQEVSKQLAKQGAHLALLDLQDQQVDSLNQFKQNKLQQVTVQKLDVSDHKQVDELINELATQWRAPDVVLHCAGLPGAIDFEKLSYEEFDRVIKVNLYGARNIAAAALPWLKASDNRPAGSLGLIASIAGIVGNYGYTSYSSSKFAVMGFAEALRAEIKPLGIGLTVFCPPEVETPLVQKEREQMNAAGLLLKKFAGSISLEHAASSFIQGVEKQKYLVVPGFMANLLLLQKRFLPRALIHKIMDIQIASVLKKK